jgi:hypothetical protein
LRLTALNGLPALVDHPLSIFGVRFRKPAAVDGLGKRFTAERRLADFQPAVVNHRGALIPWATQLSAPFKLFKAIKSPRDRAIFQITYHRGLRQRAR